VEAIRLIGVRDSDEPSKPKRGRKPDRIRGREIGRGPGPDEPAEPDVEPDLTLGPVPSDEGQP
jgi:hypothetical protein